MKTIIDTERFMRATRGFMLLYGSDPALADAALALCEPLIRRIASGTWPLAPAAEVNPDTAARAIEVALGVKVASVELFSLSTAFARLDGESERKWTERAEAMAAVLEDDIEPFMVTGGALLERRFDASRTQTDKLENALEDVFESSGFPDEKPMDFRPFGDAVPPVEEVEILSLSPFAVAYAALTVAAIGDKEAFGRMEPIMRLLPKAIPVGELKSRPGHWLVAVA